MSGMRWFSALALVLYLGLLCTPQAMVLHDPRLSPLADTELKAISPALAQYLVNQHNEQPDTDPPVLPVLIEPVRVLPDISLTSYSSALFCSAARLAAVRPRAPPAVSSH